jgi:putative ABC transport system permease protein
MLMGLIRDLHVAVRNVRRSPGAALTVALTVSVGVAAIATVFSVVDTLFLAPLPGVERPAELVNVHATAPDGSSFHSVSTRTWNALSEDPASPFSGLSAFSSRLVSLNAAGSAGEPRLGIAQLVTGNYFGVLGARAAAGRLFGTETDAGAASSSSSAASSAQVAVLSDAAWRSRFGADPSVVGRTILVNGRSFTVVGITVPGFVGTFLAQPFDVWVPLSARAVLAPGEPLRPEQTWLEMVGRLRPAVSAAGASSALAVAARRLEAERTEESRGLGFEVRPTTGFEDSLRASAVAFFAILSALALLVLLIAGGNVLGILLARGLAREKELGIRLALGAGRASVFRLVLLENLVPFLAGGGIGVALTFWTAPLLERFDLPTPVPLAFDFHPGARVVVFGMLAAAAAGLLFGSLAAWLTSRPTLLPLLRAGASTEGRRTSRVRAAFVAGELAFSVLLLVAAGLFRQTVRHSASVNPGFDARGLSVASLDLGLLGYDPSRARAALDRLTAAVRRLPGVESAAVASPVPLGVSHRTARVGLPGIASENLTSVEVADAGEGYFETMRIPIRRGRAFEPRDRKGAPPVAVVNDAFARRFWPSGQAVGQTITREEETLTVIGVVPDGKYRKLSETPKPFVYFASAQSERLRRDLVVRGGGPSSSLAAGLRRELKAIDPAIPFPSVMTMEKYIGFSTLPQRVASAVSGALGAVGLALAAIGLAGLVADSVARRTREIGLRLAVGASPRDVLLLEVGRAGRLTAAGFALGAAAAVVATPLLGQFLFGVGAAEPLIFGGVAVILAATTLLASAIPARRAARLDPLQALRSE